VIKILKNYSPTDKLIIASGVIGNMLENFDVMLCAFLAQFIAATFFQSNSLEMNIFYTFNIFFIGYLSRPIGSLLIGLYADQIGRKKTLIFSIIMVGLCTALIGLIPPYKTIGIVSTILFSLFRVLQNFSVGGEYISSISYLIESADKEKRGFFGSFVSVGFNVGSLLASILVFALIFLIEKNIIPQWSWRLLFLFSVFGTFVGLWIRRSLPESIGFILENSNTKLHKKRKILKAAINLIKKQPSRCASIMAIAWLGVSETSVLFIYSPIHMTMINNFSQQQSIGMNTICLLFLIPLIPLFGFLSDYHSKIKMLTISSLCFLALSFPYFWFLSYGNYLQIIILKLLFCIPSACFYAVAPVLITEIFPVKLRCTSLALVYQITASLAAGLAPLIMLYLANHSNQRPYSPSYFLIISILFCLAGLHLIRKNKAVNITMINEDSLSNPL
jgi:MHS family proline/betaine transporter-like MFS transporter